MPLCFWLGRTWTTTPAPGPREKILYNDDLDPPLIVYRLAPPPSQASTVRAMQDWYLDYTWPTPWAASSLPARVSFLLASQRFDRAEEELREMTTLWRSDTTISALTKEVRIELLQSRIASHMAREQHAEAIEDLRELTQLDPHSTRHAALLESLEVHVGLHRIRELVLAGKLQEARAVAQLLYEAYPGNEEVRNASADLLE